MRSSGLPTQWWEPGLYIFQAWESTPLTLAQALRQGSEPRMFPKRNPRCYRVTGWSASSLPLFCTFQFTQENNIVSSAVAFLCLGCWRLAGRKGKVGEREAVCADMFQLHLSSQPQATSGCSYKAQAVWRGAGCPHNIFETMVWRVIFMDLVWGLDSEGIRKQGELIGHNRTFLLLFSSACGSI